MRAVSGASRPKAAPDPRSRRSTPANRLASPRRGASRSELASTGVNAGALALIGALCIGASLLLFRRRHAA